MTKRMRCPTNSISWLDERPHTVVGCGSSNVFRNEEEGIVECAECGIWFDPTREDPADVYIEEE